MSKKQQPNTGHKVGRRTGTAKAPPVTTVSESITKPSVCKCGSAERSDYFGIVRQDFNGERITRKRTRCKDCGQIRIDRFVEKLEPVAQ